MKNIVVLILMLVPLCAASAFAQSQTVLFPWFASGEGSQGEQWTSEFFFTNQGMEAVAGIWVHFIDSNGNDLSVTTNLGTGSKFMLDLLRNGNTQALRLTPGSAWQEGHVQVEYPDVSSPMRGSLVVRYEKDGVVLGAVGIPQQEMGEHFSFPFDMNDSERTYGSVGLTNPMNVAQTFIVTLRSSDNLRGFAPRRIKLGAFEQTAEYIHQLFPDLEGTSFTGSVSVSSPLGAGVAAFRWYKNAFAGISTDRGPVLSTGSLVPEAFVIDADSTIGNANDDFESAQMLNPSVRVSGSIGYANDRDFYAFNGQANRLLDIFCDVTSIRNGLDVDPIVRVYDSNRNEIAYNDQSGVGPGLHPWNDSFIRILLPYTGAYYISVENSRGDGNTINHQYLLHLRPY